MNLRSLLITCLSAAAPSLVNAQVSIHEVCTSNIDLIGDEDGDLTVLPLKADFDPKKDKPLFETNMLVPIYSSPIVANGTIYIGTQTHLYAVGMPSKTASK